MNISRTYLAAALAFTVLAAGCKKEDEEPTPSTGGSGTNAALETAKQNAVNTYAEIVYNNYKDAKDAAEDLQDAIEDFLSAPSEVRFQACKDAWLLARIPYGQTEAFRFGNGPIDDENGPEGLINAWPMDEAYVDYVVGDPNAGIINNPTAFPVISADLLESLNEAGGETNISTGYHAIEFLLWGQDLSTTGPGERPWTDYTTATNATRRGQFLSACADLLVDHLGYLKDAWDNGSGGSYRTTFVNGNKNDALAAILQGIGTLAKGELAGERMEVAMLTQDQEDEHSCFSDNTHTDINMNILGVQNVYLGRYVRPNGQIVQGTSIKDVVALVNATLATEVATAIADSRTLCEAIPTPFDQQIQNGDPGGHVNAAVISLKSAGDQISAAASALGLTISTDVE